MDTIPGWKRALTTQASLLARSALCGDGEGKVPRALAGHHHGALTPGRWLSSLPQLLRKQSWSIATEQTE